MLSLGNPFGLAFFWGLTIASLPNQRQDVIAFNTPSGQGWNGPITSNVSNTAKYLQQEAGVDVERFIAYLQELSPLQPNEALPSSSGI